MQGKSVTPKVDLEALAPHEAWETLEKGGTVGNFVREAMMMERGESSHGDRERTSGPVACRPRSE